MKSLKMYYFFVASIFLTTATAAIQAALPPFYESVKEYKALLDNPELAHHLGSAELIRDIQRDDKGFTVNSLNLSMRVDIVYDPMSKPGPAKFHLVFHSPEPHEQD